MAAPKKYQPIRKLGRIWLTSGFTPRQTLWLGDNHLLSVKQLLFFEEYRRFYYKDIQAVICRKTPNGLIYTNVFLVLALLGGLAVYYNSTNVFWWIWTGMMLVGVAVNLISGPSCVCHLQTAAQVERFTRLNRIKKVNRFLTVLRPLVEGVQGGAWDPALAPAIPAVQPAPLVQPTGRRADAFPLKRESGMFHLILSLLFMANALHTLIDYDSDHIGIYFSGVLLAVTALAVTIICLIRQKKSNLAPGIQRWTWVCMGYYVCWFGMTMVFSMYLFINHPETMDDTWQMIDLAVKYSPGEPIWLHYAYLINFILAVVISVSGLLLVSRHIREERRLSSGRETG